MVVGVVLAAFAALVIYLSEPLVKVTEMRAASIPQTVGVTWIINCGTTYYIGENEKRYDPQVPNGGLEPVVKPVMYSGTEFVMTGYPYKEIHKNRLTGYEYEIRSERFDVIEWHIVPPYIALQGEDYKETRQPLGWKSENTDPPFISHYERKRQSGC